MNYKSKRMLMAFGGLGLMALLYQNFIVPSSPSVKSNIATLDPQLAGAIDKMDTSYVRYSARLQTSKAYGRMAELAFEHKKMKSDLIRATAADNLQLFNLAGEAGNYAADSGTLNAMMYQVPTRRRLYVVSVQNAVDDVRFNPTSGTTIRLVRSSIVPGGNSNYDVVLVSNVPHRWKVIEEGGTAGSVRSYVVTHPGYPTGFSYVVRGGVETFSDLVFPLQPNTTTKAQLLMDEVIKTNPSLPLDYKLAGNYAVSANTILEIKIADEAPPSSLTRGPLVVKENGFTVNPPMPLNVLAGSTFPHNISAQEVFSYLELYQSRYPAEQFAVTEFLWRGFVVKRASASLPPSPPPTPAPTPVPPPTPVPTLGVLTYSNGNTLIATIGNITEVDALTYCRGKQESNPTFYVRCYWNNKLIFEGKPAVPTPAPTPVPTPPSITGTLNYLNGGTLVATITNITEADAVKYCQGKQVSNPTFYVRCIWNGKLIFEGTPPVSPPPTPAPTPAPTPVPFYGKTYTELNKTIFSGKCLACHSSTNPSGGFNISTYEATMSTFRVVPGNPDGSRLYTRLMIAPVHPPTGPLSPAEMMAIRDWIASGAPK